MNIHEGKGYMINIIRLSWVHSCLIAVLLLHINDIIY